VKKALVVLLVLVVVVTGLPIVMGMTAMASCHDCGRAVTVDTACTLAVLATGIALVFALASRQLRSRRQVMLLLLYSFLLERPPRLA